MGEIAKIFAVCGVAFGITVGVPASYSFAYKQGLNEGIKQERHSIAFYGMGRYVFDERGGGATFEYGHKAEHKCTVCVPK